jgi:spore coat polysaccharide biosynthesis protein SpsF
MKSVLILIQARMGSKRLPEKILTKFFNEPYIISVYKRFAKFYGSKKIYIATTVSKKDDKLVNILKKNKINFYRGSENNLVLRLYNCAKKYKISKKLKNFKILRVCADMPFISIHASVESLNLLKKNVDYVGYPSNLIDGYNIESFWFLSLKKLLDLNLTYFEKEHVGPCFLNNNFKTKNISNKNKVINFKISLSLDTKKDIKRLKIVENFLNKEYGHPDISHQKMIRLIKKYNLKRVLKI